MREELEIPIQNISPYIRFVNDIRFKSGYAERERVLYDHEFIFGLSGEANLTYDGKTYHLGQSDLFYIKPHLKNHLFIDSDKTFHAHCVHFDWWLVDEQFNFTAEEIYMRNNYTQKEREFIESLKARPVYEIPDFCVPKLITDLEYDVMAPLFRELYHSFKRPDISSLLKTRALFMQIVAELYSKQFNEHGVQKNHYHQKTISQAIHYMKNHYMDPLTTPSLAEQFGLSPKYFGVLFRSMTGITVFDYLLNIRMQNAKHLLIFSELSLVQIADEIGIHDVFYFTKLFKRHEGVTPGKYRKMLNHTSQ